MARLRLYCLHKSGVRSPVDKPADILGNRKLLLACLANWLGRGSNAVARNFVDRLTGRTEVEKIVHCLQLGSRFASSAAKDQTRSTALE
jgi:hypothetical protein